MKFLINNDHISNANSILLLPMLYHLYKMFFLIVSSISMNVHKRRLSFAIVDLNHVFKMRNELNVLSGVAVEIGKTKSSFNSV